MKYIRISSKLLFLWIILSFGVTGCASMENAYQHDKDIVRMGHLYLMGDLIEKFHEKAGKYPLQDKFDLPAEVLIGTQRQIDSVTGGGGGAPYITLPVRELIKELQEVLGDVHIPIDPQKVPHGYRAPVYLYFIDRDQYFFAVHLYHKYLFANNIGRNNNKLEIGSYVIPGRVWKYEELIKNEGYIKALRNENMSTSGDLSPVIVEALVRVIIQSLAR